MHIKPNLYSIIQIVFHLKPHLLKHVPALDRVVHASTIDLVISKNVSDIAHPYTISTLPSDHGEIVFYYSTTNWKQFRSILDSLIEINRNINSTNNIDSELKKLTSSIIEAHEKRTKKRKITPHLEKIPVKILCLMRYRNKIRKR